MANEINIKGCEALNGKDNVERYIDALQDVEDYIINDTADGDALEKTWALDTLSVLSEMMSIFRNIKKNLEDED